MDPLFILVVILSYIIINAICSLVIFLMWRRIRGRFSGTGLWLAAYLAQFTGITLVLPRGIVPDAPSVVLGNGLLVLSIVLLHAGLERFLGKRGPHVQNAVLLAAFLAAQVYFYSVSPSLTARIVNISAAMLAVCAQSAWLMLHRADPEMRGFTRNPGLIFFGACLVSAARILAALVIPAEDQSLFANHVDALLIIVFQMLFISLTFSLSLMVNLRLFAELEGDIAVRSRMETALRDSEEKFSKAFHSSPDAILISRIRDGRLLEVNDGFCQLSGYSREEALNRTAAQLGLWRSSEDREGLMSALQKERSVRNREMDFRAMGGQVYRCLYSGEITDLAGEEHLVSVVRDITERQEGEEILRRSEANFREVFDNAAQGIFIVDVLEDGSFQIADVNLAEERTSGLRRGDVKGKQLELTYSPEMAKTLRAHCFRCLETGKPAAFEDVLGLPEGRKHFHITLAPVRNPAGRIHRIIGSTLDITELKQVEDILRLRLNLWEYAAVHTMEELMREALDEICAITGSPVGFYHFVREDQKTISLQAWSTRTLEEFCKAESRGMHYHIDQAGVWADSIRERKPVIHNDFAALPGRKGMPAGHAEIVRELVVPTMRSGKVVSVLGVGNKGAEYNEKDVALVAYIADIVWTIIDRKRTEEEIQRLQGRLREMAIHDSLTGLHNRHYLNEVLNRELARAAREKYPVSFVMIDIDHFKRVNDAFGHKAGDAVLQNLAAQIRKTSRAGDVVFRYGGEEFLAVLPKVRAEAALLVAEKWRKDFLDSTLLLKHGGVKPTISCGVAAFPKHGTAGADLIGAADQALYQAKAAGRNRSAVWNAPAARRRPRPKSK
jgi:diguanylate cyclase (GGDEF)-like protein/PAS domain S-box-containing protein